MRWMSASEVDSAWTTSTARSAVPFVIATFALMAAMGFTLNQITMLALTLVVGFVHFKNGAQVMLEVADNGQGFDRAALVAATGGNGLTNMEQRVRSIGGEFALESRPGGGT